MYVAQDKDQWSALLNMAYGTSGVVKCDDYLYRQ
jgi:hypothetical protein